METLRYTAVVIERRQILSWIFPTESAQISHIVRHKAHLMKEKQQSYGEKADILHVLKTRRTCLKVYVWKGQSERSIRYFHEDVVADSCRKEYRTYSRMKNCNEATHVLKKKHDITLTCCVYWCLYNRKLTPDYLMKGLPNSLFCNTDCCGLWLRGIPSFQLEWRIFECKTTLRSTLAMGDKSYPIPASCSLAEVSTQKTLALWLQAWPRIPTHHTFNKSRFSSWDATGVQTTGIAWMATYPYWRKPPRWTWWSVGDKVSHSEC